MNSNAIRSRRFIRGAHAQPSLSWVLSVDGVLLPCLQRPPALRRAQTFSPEADSSQYASLGVLSQPHTIPSSSPPKHCMSPTLPAAAAAFGSSTLRQSSADVPDARRVASSSTFLASSLLSTLPLATSSPSGWLSSSGTSS